MAKKAKAGPNKVQKLARKVWPKKDRGTGRGVMGKLDDTIEKSKRQTARIKARKRAMTSTKPHTAKSTKAAQARSRNKKKDT